MLASRLVNASLVGALIAVAAAVAPLGATTQAGESPSALRPVEAAATAERLIDLTRWRASTVKFGRFDRTRRSGGIVIGRHPTQVTYADPYGSQDRVAYGRGRWFSPWVKPGFGFTQLIASYNASTPVGTFIEVAAQGRTSRGTVSSWDSLGRWASHDTRFHRMSLGPQTDDLSRVAVDTLVAESGVAFASWRLRVTLMRRTGSGKTPTVTMVGAMSSRLPASSPSTSQTRRRNGGDLVVPRFSQEIHAGEYPQWNGGGEAWCSPTSTSMVVAYWKRGPTRRQYSWVNSSYPQPWVDFAARSTYASGYDGTGDWPFNTAYAGRFGLDAFVTRLRSLRDAELFIRAGIPLVASISFGPGQLDGAPVGSTSGHLVVVRGFSDVGRVIVNDPAAQTSRDVRRVYARGQFERAWFGSTGGVAYVIHPNSVRLPDPRRHANW